MIRPATIHDAAAIAAIYNPYIAATTISFEVDAISIEEMAQRITTITATHPWLVLEDKGAIVGYAYASPWRTRCAYRSSAESSVYLAPEAAGRGLGRQLYRALLDALHRQEVHVVIGGIAQPNPASVALHESLGFEKVAHFKQVGRKFDKWIDVAYWELVFDDDSTPA